MAAMAAAADGAASPVAPVSPSSTAGAAPSPAPAYRQPPVANDEPVQEINMLAIGLKAMWRSFLGMFGIGKKR